MNSANEINSMLLPSWGKWKWHRRTILWLQKKRHKSQQRNSKVQMPAIFYCICFKVFNQRWRQKEKVHFWTENPFKIPHSIAEDDKIHSAHLWKYVLHDIFRKKDTFNFKIELVLSWFAPWYAMMLYSSTIKYNYQLGRSGWRTKLFPDWVARTAKTSFTSSKRERSSFCSRFFLLAEVLFLVFADRSLFSAVSKEQEKSLC